MIYNSIKPYVISAIFAHPELCPYSYSVAEQSFHVCMCR